MADQESEEKLLAIEQIIIKGSWKYNCETFRFSLYERPKRRIGFIYFHVDGVFVFQFSKIFSVTHQFSELELRQGLCELFEMYFGVRIISMFP